MTTFGFYSEELELSIKFRVLSIAQCEDFVNRYEDYSKNEYIFAVLRTCIANIDSEVRPALLRLEFELADRVLLGIYNGCIMLNPVLDIRSWSEILGSFNLFNNERSSTELFFEPPPMLGMPQFEPPDVMLHDATPPDPEPNAEVKAKSNKKQFSLTKAKLATLPRYMKDRVIGQDDPIDLIYASLRRHQVGLNDPEHPIGVYLFCGPSGVGKTFIAKELNRYLFGDKTPMVRIDCGEFQHKHENQRLIGAPNGYSGYEDGGILAKMMRKSNGSIILLDEIEKAHRDFWDTFLKIFDEGFIIDSKGNFLDFRQSIFILTSNLGNEKVSMTTYAAQTGFTSSAMAENYESQRAPKREMVERMTLEAVRKYFKPELLNRIDDTVVFNHLSMDDYIKIADLEFQTVSNKLHLKNYNLSWTKKASGLLVERSAKAMEGARSMSKIRRSLVEDKIAELLFTTSYPKGKTFQVDAVNGEFKIN